MSLASLVLILAGAAGTIGDGSVIGLVRVDGGAWLRVPEGAPRRRLEAEARLPTQNWSSPAVVPGMVALEAPRIWTRLRRHLPEGWQVAAEVRWEAPSIVLRLTATPPDEEAGRGRPERAKPSRHR